MEDSVFDQANGISLKDTASAVLGININGSGTMPCPIHHETNGKSFAVYENKRWICFGKCGVHGDNIELVRTVLGISRFDAAKKICDTFHLHYELKNPSGKTLPPLDYGFLLGNIYMANYANYCLNANKEVLDYLKNKRVFSTETITSFAFGYVSKEQYDGLAPLVEAGKILKKNYESFGRHVGRLIIPLFNSSGKQILGFVSRSLSVADKVKYINDDDSSEKNGYHKRNYTYGMPQSNRESTVVIVEGYLDAPSLRQLGINSVAMGDCSLPELRFTYLNKAYAKLVLGFDNDTTGVRRTLESFKKYNHINFGYVLWPVGCKDANDCLKKNVLPTYGDFFEYISYIFDQNIGDIKSDYVARMEFITRLRDALSFIEFGNSNYFIRVEIDKKIQAMLDY